MNMPRVSENGHRLNKVKKALGYLSSRERYKRRFARALRVSWPSADALSADLIEMGYEYSPRTCQRWRNGDCMPSDAYVKDILEQAALEQTRRKIRALQQLLESYGVE